MDESNFLQENVESSGSDRENIEPEVDGGQNTDENEASDAATSNMTQTVPQVIWQPFPNNTFVPRKQIPTGNGSAIPHISLDRSCSELDVFLKMFPRSLIIFICQCTNERLTILKEQKRVKDNVPTDPSEIMIVLGILLVMSYNRVPNMQLYWSANKSMGNEAIKSAISRDRFLLLLSKLYFNDPAKSPDCSKTYYLDEVVACLKKTFLQGRSDSLYQSIDESMVKFKGRSALKQYLPLKPIKRGIKIWERCDGLTGYVYDLNIYAGKETEQLDGTLGERVVTKLCQSIQHPNVSLCFDRFFTSVNLMNNIQYAAVGTCITNRKNLPTFSEKLCARGDMEMYSSNTGLLAVKWKDTKEVVVVSNCHKPEVGMVERKNKDGSKTNVTCPVSVLFYNKHMGGVDLADQLAGLYDIDRKSNKWWKKVFYRLLLTSVVNSWILFQDIHHKKGPLLQFIVPLAEQLISYGRQHATVKRRRLYGRPSKSVMSLQNVGDHLPVEGSTRRRCHRCHKMKKEKRTKVTCSQCNVALCLDCFTVFHT